MVFLYGNQRAWQQDLIRREAEAKIPKLSINGINTVTVSRTKKRNHDVVTPLESRLKTMGYYSGAVEVDEGKVPCFGAGMEGAVKKYQSEHGCISDGENTARQRTWKSLLEMID